MTSCKPPARRCRRPTVSGKREQARPPEPQPLRAQAHLSILLHTGTDPGCHPGEPRSPPAPSSPAPRHCGRFPSSLERASTPRSLRRSTLDSGFREWVPRGAGRRDAGVSGPLPSRPRGARPPGPRGKSGGGCRRFCAGRAGAKGLRREAGVCPPPRHPASAGVPAPLPAHLLDGGGRDLALAPLSRGRERHRHVAAEPAISESRALQGPRSWGPDARLRAVPP